ncbi:MAG: hypothetical protein J6A40_06645 [Bacteroides sp.]|nr:hypothetical protein [Bacteroides sp.]
MKVGKDAISITKVNVEPWTTYTIDGGVAEEVFPSIDGTDYASLSALQNAVKEKFSDEDVPSFTKPLNIRNQRDLSCKEYKRHYHMSNDSNYVLAIYEGVVRGNVKRSFELVNKLDAGKFFKRSTIFLVALNFVSSSIMIKDNPCNSCELQGFIIVISI